MAAVGELKNIKIEHEIEWKILNFSSLSDKNTKYYSSSNFSFCNESWYLSLYPNGYEEASAGYISVYLRKMASDSSIKVEFSLGLKTLSGQKYSDGHTEYIFKKEESGCGYGKLLSRSELLKKKADLLPGDVITVFCSLKIPAPGETVVEKVLNTKGSLCEKIVDANSLSLHPKKDKPIKCADCSAVFTLINLCDHECQAPKRDSEPITALGKGDLSESSKALTDFKELFLRQQECDVVIRVKGQEFSAHKAILIARSSVFESTFRNDMKEKKSGIIDIDDCDPSSFRNFLLFLYCEDSEGISEENVFNLFVTADKYDVKDLRAKCIEFIIKCLSVDTFCDTIILALQYSETELTKLATEFFAKNLKKIILTVKWQSFLAEYPTWSNELFIKALAADKDSDA